MDYGFSKEMSPTDERQEKWKKQREERGFDSTELWALDVATAKFLLPRLKAFKEGHAGVPGYIDPDNKKKDKGAAKWNKILQDMIDGFEIIANVDGYDWKDESGKPEKAVKLLAKHYFALWS